MIKMKKSYLLLTFIAFIFTNLAFAQTTQDKIIKKDYQIIEATVTKIADKFIEYKLPNETLIYNLDISKIARIDFANGKSQSFIGQNGTQQQNVNSENSVYQGNFEEIAIKPNTLAILPIPFDNQESHSSSESMAKFAQNDVYSNILKLSNINRYEVQDLRTTNALLRKANVSYKNVDEIPISDLQKILGVDNILAIKVSYTIIQSQSTIVIGQEDIDDFALISTDDDKMYEFTVYFDLYKNNQKVYTKSRKPFFSMKDSWMDSVNYLLKRCPLN